MSAPDTNIDVQKARHKPSLFGVGLAAAFGVAMIAALVLVVVGRADAPEGAATQIDSRTGTAVPAE